MPRKASSDAPGALHNIIVRGFERRNIFKDDTDRINFLDRLGKVFSKPEEIFQPGKKPIKVKARSLFCYWAVRELGLTTADLAPQLNISQPAVSMSTQRGERIVSENEYSLMNG